jgi:hypothetical protein
MASHIPNTVTKVAEELSKKKMTCSELIIALKDDIINREASGMDSSLIREVVEFLKSVKEKEV